MRTAAFSSLSLARSRDRASCGLLNSEADSAFQISFHEQQRCTSAGRSTPSAEHIIVARHPLVLEAETLLDVTMADFKLVLAVVPACNAEFKVSQTSS